MNSVAENFQFQKCKANQTTDEIVDLPGWYATVTRGPGYIAETVFFHSEQTTFDLRQGEVDFLVSQGKARRS